jgi:hypothetical protein
MKQHQRNTEPISISSSSGRPFRDFANVNEEELKGASSTKDSCFPEKLHYVLSEMEKDGLQHIASWQPHGRCFIVHDQKLFTERILHL